MSSLQSISVAECFELVVALFPHVLDMRIYISTVTDSLLCLTSVPTPYSRYELTPSASRMQLQKIHFIYVVYHLEKVAALRNGHGKHFNSGGGF